MRETGGWPRAQVEPASTPRPASSTTVGEPRPRQSMYIGPPSTVTSPGRGPATPAPPARSPPPQPVRARAESPATTNVRVRRANSSAHSELKGQSLYLRGLSPLAAIGAISRYWGVELGSAVGQHVVVIGD